jgi:hypothetical protein
VAIALANAVTFGAACFAVVVLFPTILLRFLLVTLGPRVSIAQELFTYARQDFLHAGRAAALVAITLFLAVASRREGRFNLSYRTALAPLPLVGLFALQAASYRFLGIALLVPAALACVRYQLGLARLRAFVLCLSLTLIATLAPVDLTLQTVPGLPRVVPTSFGLMSSEGRDMAERGEFVIVDACRETYNHPRWAVVW